MKKYILFIALLMCILHTYAQIDTRREGYNDASIILAQEIDSIVVLKGKREMFVFSKKKQVKKYIISLGIEPSGKKQFEGDLRTPEGEYIINDRSKYSSYHANLGVNYPSYLDSIYAKIYGLRAGGDIKIHGFPNKHRKDQEQELLNSDWTIGCIAVADWEIDELYQWVKWSCPITILP